MIKKARYKTIVLSVLTIAICVLFAFPNKIKADTTQTTQATALATYLQDDITYVIDCSVTGKDIYNDSLRVYNTYPEFHAYVIANEPVNGYITFRFYFNYYGSGSDGNRYVNLMVTLSNGYGELTMTGTEAYSYGNLYTDCSIDTNNTSAYVLSITEYGTSSNEDIEDYAIDIDSSGILSTITDTSLNGSTLTNDNYYCIHIAENQQPNTIYVIKSNIGSRNDVTAEISEIYAGNALGSLSAVSNLDSYVINNRTSSTIILNSNYNAMANKYIAFKFSLSSSMAVVSGVDMVLYAIPLESDLYIQYYNLMNYNRTLGIITNHLNAINDNVTNIDSTLDDIATDINDIAYSMGVPFNNLVSDTHNILNLLNTTIRTYLYNIKTTLENFYNAWIEGNSETNEKIDNETEKVAEDTETISTLISDYNTNITSGKTAVTNAINGMDFTNITASAVFVANVMTSLYNNMGDFRLLVTIPLLVGILLLFIHRPRLFQPSQTTDTYTNDIYKDGEYKGYTYESRTITRNRKGRTISSNKHWNPDN